MSPIYKKLTPKSLTVPTSLEMLKSPGYTQNAWSFLSLPKTLLAPKFASV